MVSTSLPRAQLQAQLPRSFIWALLIGTTVSASLGSLGGAWDVAYHRTYLVDTFFSPPHLLIYSGMLGMLLIGIAIVLLLHLHADLEGGMVQTLVQHPMLAIPLITNFAFLATGPLDDLWHRTFGRDKLTVWSPPHTILLLNIALSCASAICLAYWLRSTTPASQRLSAARTAGDRWTRICMMVGLTLMIGNLWGFCTGWERGSTDDSTFWMDLPWLSLPLMSLEIAMFITIATRLLPSRWWVGALVVGCSTWLWWVLPGIALGSLGYKVGDMVPIVLPLGSLGYGYLVASNRPPLVRWLCGTVLIASALGIAYAANQTVFLAPTDILLGLPLAPLMLILGEALGADLVTFVRHLAQHSATPTLT